MTRVRDSSWGPRGEPCFSDSSEQGGPHCPDNVNGSHHSWNGSEISLMCDCSSQSSPSFTMNLPSRAGTHGGVSGMCPTTFSLTFREIQRSFSFCCSFYRDEPPRFLNIILRIVRAERLMMIRKSSGIFASLVIIDTSQQETPAAVLEMTCENAGEIEPVYYFISRNRVMTVT